MNVKGLVCHVTWHIYISLVTISYISLVTIIVTKEM